VTFVSYNFINPNYSVWLCDQRCCTWSIV